MSGTRNNLLSHHFALRIISDDPTSSYLSLTDLELWLY
jgi:hypothetical protein